MGRKHNIIVVGNGLFGSIAATLARAEGHQVTVISNNEKHAASLASGCVLAPSWLTSMEPDQRTTAMQVLHDLYTVHELEFTTNLLKKFRASRVALGDVLVKPDVVGAVTHVGAGQVTVNREQVYKGKILVATGAWTGNLVQMPPIRGLWGASVRIKGQIEKPLIHVYAPYKQAVAFNADRGHVWAGDGTALIEKTWRADEAERIKLTHNRIRHLFKLGKEMDVPGGLKTQVGVRPYVEGHKAGYFAQVAANTWVSTGGAKNGTVLAAWQAYRFLKELS